MNDMTKALLEAAKGIIEHIDTSCPTWEWEARIKQLREAIKQAEQS